MDGPRSVTFSKNRYPKPIEETDTICAEVEVTDNGTSIQSLPVDDCVCVALRSPMPDICARLRTLVNGEFPLPPETDEPAMDTVTGASKPSASGAMLTRPEFTVADSGINTVRL